MFAKDLSITFLCCSCLAKSELRLQGKGALAAFIGFLLFRTLLALKIYFLLIADIVSKTGCQAVR